MFRKGGHSFKTKGCLVIGSRSNVQAYTAENKKVYERKEWHLNASKSYCVFARVLLCSPPHSHLS